MKENNDNKPAGNKQHSKETETSIENGKKAIEMDKKTGAPKPGKQEEEKADAENWRNEG